MSPRNVIIFLSSVRPNRMADRVLNLVKGAVETKGMEVTVFDPLEMPFELVKVPLHFMPNQDLAPTWLREANEKIQKADAFLILTAEYNCGVPPALSNILDHFPPASFRHRPCGIVTYSMGNFGGIRVLSPLYAVLHEFGMIDLPTNLQIPTVHTSLAADGKCSVERITSKLDKVLEDLAWYTEAIVLHKNITPAPQPATL